MTAKKGKWIPYHHCLGLQLVWGRSWRQELYLIQGTMKPNLFAWRRRPSITLAQPHNRSHWGLWSWSSCHLKEKNWSARRYSIVFQPTCLNLVEYRLDIPASPDTSQMPGLSPFKGRMSSNWTISYGKERGYQLFLEKHIEKARGPQHDFRMDFVQEADSTIWKALLNIGFVFFFLSL